MNLASFFAGLTMTYSSTGECLEWFGKLPGSAVVSTVWSANRELRTRLPIGRFF
jgi:hypothetical protein